MSGEFTDVIFVRPVIGVPRGHLYLNQPEGFVLATSRSPDPPPLHIEEWLLRWLQAFRSEPGDGEATDDGRNSSPGDQIKLVPLVTDDGGSPVVPGVVVLEWDGAYPSIVPEQVLRELANVLIDAGDVPRA